MEISSLISVIVPVYKVEDYLSKCIESILNQTYTRLELLLVDDGSPDRCGYICDEYARKDSRVRVFHKPNGGVGDARNVGLEHATGDYIAFVDADDWIESDMLETLLHLLLLHHDAGMSCCGLQKEDEAGNVLGRRIANDETEVKDQLAAVLTLFIGDRYHSCQGWVTNKLFKGKIIESKRIRFRKDIYYSEDRLFCFEYLKFCSSAVFFSLPKYHYLVRNDSAMNEYILSGGYRDKYATFIAAFEEMFEYSHLNYPFFICQAAASNYVRDVLDFYFKYRQDICRRAMDVQLNAIIRRMLPYLTGYERSVYRLFLFHPMVYSFFVRLRHRAYILKMRFNLHYS